ncbi:MAG: asparagine synthase (glutamine-hydrolyzing) [Actinomycetota bacterium]|nr:asparagine synthase (glutamine-hydrolyzing) [Actinomycetota bacterium]
MCGIAGAWEAAGDRSPGELAETVAAMAATLRHRGPDDHGVWTDAGAGVALGHRRLSIIDLSPEGHQPMVSASQRYVLSFNGELYNFEELREQLARRGHSFRGRSDTEVLLAACEEWGLDGALDRFNGMFAFALWDARARALHLVRDPVGEKPLYYGRVGGALVFASELDAVRAHPRVGAALEIDRDALSAYLRLNYVPAPHSIYRGVHKLPAGHVVTVRDAGEALPEPRCYWPLAEVVAKARAGGITPVSVQEAADRLDALLRESVRLRMHADVPLGAFLSGGIDSSVVVALMQAQSDRPVRTFTVGFDDRLLDESAHARTVARHLGTDHTEIRLSPEAALELVPRLPRIYDEPFADPSQLPTTAIAEVARRHVTVCLSGDGGDEVFGGYNRYTEGERAWGLLERVPGPVRQAAARAFLATPGAVRDRFVPPAKAQKLASVLRAGSGAGVYTALVSAWDDPDSIVVDGAEPESPAEIPPGLDGLGERMMFLDSLSTLPDEMLAKVDRASMSVGLETRVPLLDPCLVEFAWSVPREMRIRDGQGKWLLRQVLYRYVPADMVERPKTGFDPPVAAWLRGPLRPWASALLEPSRLRREGYLRVEPVTQCWAEHLAGSRNWDYRLWSVLMFQAWLESR